MARLLRLPLLPLALLCVLLLRLFKIRIGQLWSERLGHLAGNTEVYLCEKDAGLHPGRHIWIHRKPISNQQIAKMYDGQLTTFRDNRFIRLVRLLNGWFPGQTNVGSIQLDRDICNLLERTPPHIRFTDEEERWGQEELRKWGIGPKWACLIVRDGTYLPTLEYHAYRDSKIDDYRSACEALAERGYHVLRMGAQVKSPIGWASDRIIDYATNGMRSDFLDAYLGSKCEFCISTGTGFDAIPYVFRRPICYVNYVPVEYLFTFVPKSLSIWKHHYRDGKRMRFQEIIDSGAGQFMAAGEFKNAGISLVDNSPEEIRDVALEMACGLSTKPQDEFWNAFPRSVSPFNRQPLHGLIRMRIGHRFLENELASSPQQRAA